MAQKSSFFNSVNGDRKYSADDFANYISKFVGNGIFPKPATGLQVTQNTGMTIKIAAGVAWVNGRMFENTSDLIMTHDNADGGSSRVDRVVVQYSKLNREIVIKIKKGTIGSSTAPALQRDADIYELSLATVAVNKGAIDIKQINIDDTRLDTTVCGLAINLVQTIDLKTFSDQYKVIMDSIRQASLDDKNRLETSNAEWRTKEQAEVDKIEADFKKDFEAWFTNVKNQLSENQAGNLQNQINTNRDNINQVKDTELPNLAKELRNDIADTQILTIMGVF
jgi:gas vesicle protein